MSHHRLTHLLAPQPTAPIPAPGAFMACPLAAQPAWAGQVGAWQQVYAVAFARALEVMRPSRVERLQACLNN